MMNAFLQPFGFVWMILWWAVAIAMVAWIARYVFPHRHGRHCAECNGGPRGRAADIVKERYARGELTKEQFESMKKDLET